MSQNAVASSSGKASPGTTIFSVNNPQDLLLEDFDSQVFCYHRLTGETHYLTRLPAEVLFLLYQESMSLPKLVGSLAERFSLGESAELEGQIRQSLQGLQQQALIQSVTKGDEH